MAALRRLHGDVTKPFQSCNKHQKRKHFCSKCRAASPTSGPPCCYHRHGDIHDDIVARYFAPAQFRASQVRDAACSLSHPQSQSFFLFIHLNQNFRIPFLSLSETSCPTPQSSETDGSGGEVPGPEF